MMRDEQINQLEGRAMDAAVAEQVFGYEVRIATESDPLILICAADNCADRDSVEPGEPYLWIVKSGHQPERGLPHYSTDIAAAWLVIQKMQTTYYVNLSTFWLEGGSLGGVQGWRCTFSTFRTHVDYQAEAPTVELAICKAAIVALRAALAEGE